MSISSSPNGFLDLPARPSKPRDVGITHVMDKGLGLSQIESLLAGAGDYVDIVKLGWGTSYVTQNLREKLALYRSLGIPVICGGTLLEIAEARGKLDGYRSWLSENGFESVEVSDGTIDLPRERKLEIIETLARDFRVLSEVGSKDAEAVFAPYQWVEWIREELGAGSWKVITEARESGTAGIFRGSGEVRSGLIDEIVHELPVERLLFEAPQKAQQAWFIRQFGSDVNLGNIPPDEVIPLETLRLGLRSDTMSALLLDVKA
jgi:phosphosulfolactate synthase